MDLIGRSIADAVAQSLAGPLLRRSSLTKKIPTVSLRRLPLNPHVRSGNIPALFADLAEDYGPVFAIRPQLAEPLIFLAGPETNRWVHRSGRMHLRAKDFSPISRRSMVPLEYYHRLMAPIISGFASPWGRRILTGD